jgi:hypothetical protein
VADETNPTNNPKPGPIPAPTSSTPSRPQVKPEDKPGTDQAKSDPVVSESAPNAGDTGTIGPDSTPEASKDFDPGVDPDATPDADPDSDPDLDPIPTHGDTSKLKTDRVAREGDPDMNAVSDTTYQASGNRYPLSGDAAEGLARNLEGEADRLENLAKLKRAEATEARAKADDIKANEEGA